MHPTPQALTTNDTLAVGFFNLVLWAATQRGADGAALCQRVGVDPAQLHDPDARVPITAVQQLWREAVQATHDPHLDLHLGEQLTLGSLGIMGYVMMHCPTLGAALEQLARYQDIVCAGVRLTQQREGATCRLRMELLSADIIYPAYVFNSELAAYLNAFRALTNQPIAPLEIHFAYPRPADTQEHERVFAPARLLFNAAHTSLVFDAAVLDLPVFNANATLFPLFEQHAQAMLAQLRQPSLADRVKQEIAQLLKGAAPALSAVADRLNLGVRTLQLHLRAANLTYQQLLDEVRRELAEWHLRAPHLSTTDIAFLLGYSEPSVFVRSFKRWTGQTPGAYRRHQLAQA